ncbi:hypothetical protein ACIQBJ_03420 [Kitasatospora sp. NPDC088391]|uniref:hypothetical protein n=1 Tax=Kitasatospora sp. NPDC088391 TaxID=3364074 RepID=UPI0038238954
MRPSDPAPGGDHDPDWNLTLDEEFVRAAAFREDTLHARPAGPPEPGPRTGLRRLVLSGSALVLAAVGAWLLYVPASRAPESATEVNAAAVPPLALPADWVAPLDAVFPERPAARPADRLGPAPVRESAADLPSCADPAVPAPQGELLRRAGRCVAAQRAVYTVGEGRLTMSVLTMASAEQADAAVSALRTAPAADPAAPAADPPPSVGRADRTVWLYTFTGTAPAPTPLPSQLVGQFMARWTTRAEQASAGGPTPAR